VSTHPCPACGTPAPDTTLCATCVRELRDALTDLAPGRPQLPTHATGPAGRRPSLRWDLPTAVHVGGLADHLQTTTARLARIGTATGPSAVKPPPFHEKAAAVRDHLLQALTPWARHALELHRPTPQPPACRHRDPVGVDCRPCALDAPAAHAARIARWNAATAALDRGDLAAIATQLLDDLHTLTVRDDAADLHHTVTTAVAQVERVIDRPADEWFAGDCGAEHDDGHLCDVPLYAEPGATYVTCTDRAGRTGCGTTWSVADRRTWLLKSAEDHLGTATLISQALTRLDQPVTADRIRKWKQRGRLTERPEGSKLYRLGDVLDLLAADDQAHARRHGRISA
jgi:hypothetical protein